LVPPIGLMFFCLAVLEDSGYMARAAFVMDRLMRMIGLPGKAFVPMLIGFGCTVPAIMATRTLPRERDRLMTIAMNPLMSCGARLPVYVLFGIAFFPRSRGLLVFSLYAVGILLAVATGLVLKSSILKKQVPQFVMELPPYHVPAIKGLAIHTWHRFKGFAVRAGKVILLAVIVISFLNSLGPDGTFGHQDTGESILATIGRAITPVFRPMGIRDENWPATVGLFSGVFAKEAVVGTLNSLYGRAEAGDEPPFDLAAQVRGAFATIPANLRDTFGGGLIGTIFGLGVTTEAVAEPGVGRETYVAMQRQFDGRVGAYAYLLFVLIYVPCVAAIAAIYRETNLRWTAFVVGYLTLLAWVVSVGFYQAATFGRHPASSAGWLAGLLAAFVLYVLALRAIGSRREAEAG
ncbi:MAG: ferrous iron transport protein B, partial [bacterium]